MKQVVIALFFVTSFLSGCAGTKPLTSAPILTQTEFDEISSDKDVFLISKSGRKTKIIDAVAGPDTTFFTIEKYWKEKRRSILTKKINFILVEGPDPEKRHGPEKGLIGAAVGAGIGLVAHQYVASQGCDGEGCTAVAFLVIYTRMSIPVLTVLGIFTGASVKTGRLRQKFKLVSSESGGQVYFQPELR